MPAGLRHGLNRGINQEWHKMPTLAGSTNKVIVISNKTFTGNHNLTLYTVLWLSITLAGRPIVQFFKIDEF